MRRGDKYLVFTVLLIFLFFIGLGLNEFVGYSIYDPGIGGGELIKTALWNFSDSNSYNYSSSINFSQGYIALLKPAGFLHSEFVGSNNTNINLSQNDIRLNLVNGSYYSSGEYISEIYDSDHNSTLWGSLSWSETLNNQTITVSYKTGDSLGEWVVASNNENLSSNGRYFQYKVELISDNSQTPIIDDISVETKYFSEGSIETEFLNVSNLINWISLDVSTTEDVSYDYNIGNGWVDVPIDFNLLGLATDTAKIKFKADLVSDGLSTPNLEYLNLTYNVSESNTSSNSAPVLTNIGDQEFTEDEWFYHDVDATDADGDILTFSDNTSLFDINSSSGEINFTSGDTGNHSVEISVSDGVLSDSESIVFNILDAPPREESTEETSSSDSSEDSGSESSEQTTSSEDVAETVAEGSSAEEVIAEGIVENIDTNQTGNITGFQKLFTGFGVAMEDVEPMFFVSVLVIALVFILLVVNYFYLKKRGSSYRELVRSIFKKRNFK